MAAPTEARRALRSWPGRAGAVGTAALGHAAAGNQPVRLVALALHLAAALTWAGSVACLGIALLRARRALPRPYVLAALRRFARPAVACLAVTAVTGTFLASDTIGLDAALRTTYGRSFLLKLLLVALASGVALLNHRRLRHRIRTRVPTRTVAIEGLVAVLIVLVTAVVVSGQPATEPQLVDRGPAATDGPLAGRFADLQESFDLRPNHPGDATAVVTVFDTRRPSPGPVTAVSVRLGTNHPVPASVVSDGTWAARLPGVTAGPVGIEVRVTRAGAPTVTAHYGWSAAPASRPEPRLVSRAHLSHGPALGRAHACGRVRRGGRAASPPGSARPATDAAPRSGQCDTRSGRVAGGQSMTTPRATARRVLAGLGCLGLTAGVGLVVAVGATAAAPGGLNDETLVLPLAGRYDACPPGSTSHSFPLEGEATGPWRGHYLAQVSAQVDGSSLVRVVEATISTSDGDLRLTQTAVADLGPAGACAPLKPGQVLTWTAELPGEGGGLRHRRAHRRADRGRRPAHQHGARRQRLALRRRLSYRRPMPGPTRAEPDGLDGLAYAASLVRPPTRRRWTETSPSATAWRHGPAGSREPATCRAAPSRLRCTSFAATCAPTSVTVTHLPSPAPPR